MTANQLIASNLKRARQLAGLTQEQAAERLEPYLGKRWSKANFSALERSAGDARTREFSADEVLACSQAFDVPVAFFFTPEVDHRGPVSCGGPRLVELPELLAAVSFIDGPRVRAIATRLPEEARPAFDQVLRRNVLDRVSPPTVNDVTHHSAHLREIANALERADDRVLAVFADELDRALAKEEENDG